VLGSEAIVDLYGARLGLELSLPMPEAQRFAVAGVWRDYARQTGAIVIEASVYQRLNGDNTRPSRSVSCNRAHGAEVTRQLAAQRQHAARFNERGRSARSVAHLDPAFGRDLRRWGGPIAIGLVGIAATFSSRRSRASANSAARHLGARAGRSGDAGAGAGLLTAARCGRIGGACNRVDLGAIVNPQSFHWTMDWRCRSARWHR